MQAGELGRVIAAGKEQQRIIGTPETQTAGGGPAVVTSKGEVGTAMGEGADLGAGHIDHTAAGDRGLEPS